MKRFILAVCALALLLGALTTVTPVTYALTPQERLGSISEARDALEDILADQKIQALVYLTDEYAVRTLASEDSEIVVTVPSGQTVQILDVALDSEGMAWVYVLLASQGTEYRGYIRRSNVACSDERFLAWEETYGLNRKAGLHAASTISVTATADEGVSADIAQFPESYQAALTALKEAHPNWTFVMMNTGLDWSEVVAEEMLDSRNLIQGTYPEYMLGSYYGTGWYNVTEETLDYYLDPRNALTETGIFQFEQLTYNDSYHTEEATQLILNSTFMCGAMPNTTQTYANAFYTIGQELKVSPFHLACRVYQEQGAGTSPLISGTYPGYEGYYNYFNIKASGSTTTEIYVNGLSYAKSQGWSTPYLSIQGGAESISANYILKGQDTLYLQKFDVDDSYSGMYWHQYMQNVMAPTSEALNIRKAYENAGALDNTFVFKIPVYENMPQSACPYPRDPSLAVSDQITLTLPDGYTDTTVYLDGVAYTGTVSDGAISVQPEEGKDAMAVMYQYNSSGVPVGMYVWSVSYSDGGYTVTALPEFENILQYNGFSIRITGNSGIRCKTSIPVSLRGQLTGSGVNGYTLKSYGTLVMTSDNAALYDMVLNGQKVANAMAYGVSDGTLVDSIFETVDSRYRFTAVMVGLPAAQYKTSLSFRGYVTLTKNGTDYTIYGPIVSRDIYSLAQQILATNTYAEGSAAYNYLKQLIADADALE